MKPINCIDEQDLKLLDHQGYQRGSYSIVVKTVQIEIEYGSCKMTIPKYIFNDFINWYNTDQNEI